jgi:hypothetical protein
MLMPEYYEITIIDPSWSGENSGMGLPHVEEDRVRQQDSSTVNPKNF